MAQIIRPFDGLRVSGATCRFYLRAELDEGRAINLRDFFAKRVLGGLVKSLGEPLAAIPAQAGIQSFQELKKSMDTRSCAGMATFSDECRGRETRGVKFAAEAAPAPDREIRSP